MARQSDRCRLWNRLRSGQTLAGRRVHQLDVANRGLAPLCLTHILVTHDTPPVVPLSRRLGLRRNADSSWPIPSAGAHFCVSLPALIRSAVSAESLSYSSVSLGNLAGLSCKRVYSAVRGGALTTLVFVHGTGVRQAAYRVTFERFVEKAAKIRPDSVVAGCYWGGPHGSRLNAGGASIPAGESYRGLETLLSGPTADADAEVALWGLLERDSLAELRLLSAAWASEEELAPHAEPTGQQLAARARRLLVSMPVMSQAASVGLDSVFPESVDAILGSQVTIGALRQERSLGGEVYALLARAFVADALRRADEELDGTFPLDGPHRADLIAAIVGELGGTDRGLGSALGRFGLSAALALGATRPVERRRSAITEASAPASGDVLMYLARGNAIRDFIAGTIHAADGPVVLIGHSLGGIACLDALASRALPKVELLVTVGSQAPFLYELNALPSLAFGHHLPTTVPRWVNIFDRRDLLAFTAASIFPGRARDCEVDCGAPFPRSHSAYFAHDRFYSVLNEILP